MNIQLCYLVSKIVNDGKELKEALKKFSTPELALYFAKGEFNKEYRKYKESDEYILNKDDFLTFSAESIELGTIETIHYLIEVVVKELN